LWSGEPFSFQGEFFTIDYAQQLPTPLDRIPLLIGGAGPRTMELVAEYADWWNCPVHRLDKLDEMRPRAGTARVSTQQMVTFVVDPSQRDEIVDTANRRFATMGQGRFVGDGSEIRDAYAALAEQGVERFYCWFTDFADPRTLEAFGASVIDGLG
jgi:alkanesulfonate monooxygenase SsuD/methylene tetrahydromethanopterin reductase-like flavin-dependent oxidoreductase (luciferase family)